MSLSRALGAEALGTALLLAIVVGSGIMGETLAGGNVAVALLANSLATVGGLYVLIAMLGPVSGGHFNPAVSLVMALDGALPWRRLLPYGLAQGLGGIAGVWLAHLMFARPVFELSARARGGLAQGIAEATATFGLIFTILMLARSRPQLIPAAVAAYIGAAYWFTASTSFANPAVTVARALTDSFAGIAPGDVPAFIAAQLVGAILAMLMARWLRTAAVSDPS